MRKKKGGKGLSVLSGRDLFSYKKELFEVAEDDLPATIEEENGDAKPAAADGADVDQVAAKVQSDLFLKGDDDDLDDLDDD